MSTAVLRAGSRALCRRPLVAATVSNKRLAHTSDSDLDLENYPKLPDESRQLAPPKGWDDMLLRRNFGDPVHEQEELYSMWGPDVSAIPADRALRHFGLAVLGFIGFGAFVKFGLAPEPPMARRAYPHDGLNVALGGYDDNQARKESEPEE